MKLVLFILVFAVLVLSCQNVGKSGAEEPDETHLPDTIVGKKNITDELAGGAYRNRATQYFLITKGDTSNFSIYLSEYNESDTTLRLPKLGLGIAQQSDNTSYRQRLEEFPFLLHEAHKDYLLDSLGWVGLNTLMSNGDLAVKVSEELLQAFPQYHTKPNIRNEDYSKIFDFLLESQLTKDMNDLFSPYNLTVDYVRGEKLGFVDKTWFYQHFSTEIDSSKAPDKIFDCMISVSMKKKL